MTSKSHGHDEVKRTTDADMEVEAYRDGGSVVLFDSGNPLAWVEASRSISLREAT